MLEVIKKRRSIRNYLPKKVEEKKLNEILKAAMFSPSAHHRRPWEFIIVKNPKAKRKLSQATPYSSFIRKAPAILAICADERKAARWIEDCAIAAENIYLEATNQGLGACFVQIRKAKTHQGKDAEEYAREILSIPKNIRLLCLMPIGYPTKPKKPHAEKEFEKQKIHREKW